MAEKAVASPSPSSARLMSLDVFRGLTMASMVVVNNPGTWADVYAPLRHAEWNGCTPTDLIFPFFLYMVGVSMTLSRSTTSSWRRILKRTATIILIGWFLTLFPYFRFPTWRLPGVLVRIALCYLAAAAIFRATLPRGAEDLRRHALRLGGWAAALMLGYWAAVVWMPWPGHVTGDLSPTGNLGGFIDRVIIGQQHMYRQREWDPEGLFSTAPAIATTLLGIISGLWLKGTAERWAKALVLAASGVAAMALGLLWDLAFPMNKNLWTSSFVMYTAGAGAVAFAACYFVLDVKGWRWWAKPFVILGMNAIALYALSGLFAKSLGLIKVAGPGGSPVSLQGYLYTSFFAPLASPKNASLAAALAHLAVLFVALSWMYRRNIFLKA